jgi:hypothetical protein
VEETQRMADELVRAREAAHAYTAATRDTAAFLDRIGDVPDPAYEAEYAALLAREEETLADRQDALHALGLDVRSLEAE